MYKKSISYTDYAGNERKEDFFFNLTKAELVMMNTSEVGGLKAKMDRMLERQDGAEIMNLFHDIIHRSYGERSADGRRFIKSEELATAFEQTEAYSELFMELCTNAKAAAEFINGILPADLNSNAAQLSPAPGTHP